MSNFVLLTLKHYVVLVAISFCPGSSSKNVDNPCSVQKSVETIQDGDRVQCNSGHCCSGMILYT